MSQTHALFLLSRLEAIGHSLAKRESALALIGLGSVGRELHRLDEYSDLDFFVVVAGGAKRAYLQDLSWLEEVAQPAYQFRNTPDGYKLLFADGIFCEFAVFEQDELRSVPFSAGRVVWKRENIPESIAVPEKTHTPQEKPTVEWLIGETLTNLYMGLSRDRRGEKLSAMRFIQVFAVERLLELAEIIELATPSRAEYSSSVLPDVFAPERRFEQRYPWMEHALADFMQGYERNRQSARAVLEFLEEHFKINQAMRKVILDYCQ
jgi:hypothetical protein